MQLLSDIEKSVVQRLRDERKRTQARTAIQMVTRRLGRKITRGLPFPPGSRPQREEDFDFERILDATRKQEGLLTPALHARELLKSEIKREEAMLEREQAALERLEKNASAERGRRKAEAKKLHPSLAKRGGEVVEWSDRDQLNLADEQTTADVLQVSLLVVSRRYEANLSRTRRSMMTSGRLWRSYRITWRACRITSSKSKASYRR